MGSEARSSVEFTCQRCLQPLRLNAQLAKLSEHALAELRLPARSQSQSHSQSPSQSQSLETHKDDGDNASFDARVPPYRHNNYNGFTLLMTDDEGEGEGEGGRRAPGEGGGLGARLALSAELFDALSDNSDVDHPLCDECTDSLLQLMDERLVEAEAELKDYEEYLEKIESERDELDADALERELAARCEEERRLLDELAALRREELELAREVEARERERERLAEERAVYSREYARYRKDSIDSEDRTRRHEASLAYTQAQLERLKKTDAFKAAFYVSDSGRFGIVNNFRLGRLPDAPVDWSEINAAWGQTALLLRSLARRIRFDFERYDVVPYGNRSYVESLEDHKELPLYGSGGFKLLWDTKFDEAMVAFLDCVQQFKERVKQIDPEFNLPYKMSKGKIEDPSTGNSYSIKIQFNSEEQWTLALKYLLTNLKWGLAWVSSQFSDDKTESS